MVCTIPGTFLTFDVVSFCIHMRALGTLGVVASGNTPPLVRIKHVSSPRRVLSCNYES